METRNKEYPRSKFEKAIEVELVKRREEIGRFLRGIQKKKSKLDSDTLYDLHCRLNILSFDIKGHGIRLGTKDSFTLSTPSNNCSISLKGAVEKILGHFTYGRDVFYPDPFGGGGFTFSSEEVKKEFSLLRQHVEDLKENFER